MYAVGSLFSYVYLKVPHFIHRKFALNLKKLHPGLVLLYLILNRSEANFQTGHSSSFETRLYLPHQGIRQHKRNRQPY